MQSPLSYKQLCQICHLYESWLKITKFLLFFMCVCVCLSVFWTNQNLCMLFLVLLAFSLFPHDCLQTSMAISERNGGPFSSSSPSSGQLGCWRDAQCLRELAALPENPGQILNTHVVTHNHLDLQSGVPMPPFLASMATGTYMQYTGIHLDKTLLHIKKKFTAC